MSLPLKTGVDFLRSSVHPPLSSKYRQASRCRTWSNGTRATWTRFLKVAPDQGVGLKQAQVGGDDADAWIRSRLGAEVAAAQCRDQQQKHRAFHRGLAFAKPNLT
jgi:hypothetical protein